MNREESWLYNYNLVKDYYDINGNLLIPSDYVVNGVNLNRWLANQKYQYKIGNLSKKRIELLNKLNITWTVRTYSWEVMYNLVKKYYDEKGDLLVPHSYEVAIDGGTIKLGSWLHDQRSLYKTGKLPQNRIKLLEDIGMKWGNVKNDILDRKWFIMYKEAFKYYEENGNLVVPNGYNVTIDKKEYSLRRWIRTQKDYFVNNELSEDKKELFIKLLNLCNIMSVSDLKFLKYYSICKMYYETNGDLNVPYNYEITVNGEVIKLGLWIVTQRMCYKGKGNLSDERIRMLEEIGMLWELSGVKEDEWNINYQFLKSYYETNGNLFIPDNYSQNGINLDKWLNNQIRLYKNGNLSKEKVEMLNNIGISLLIDNKLSVRWERKYQLAKKYYEKNGNLQVPSDYTIDDVNLGNWLVEQRKYYNWGKLSKEKIDLLNKIGMVWILDDKLAIKWERKYQLAKEYYEKNGNLQVPFDYIIDDIKLGSWIVSQRRYYKNGKLSEEKVEMLNDIGMIWTFNDERLLNWERNYKLAKDYYEKNGNLKVPRDYAVDGVNLGAWISTQKYKYNQGKLTSYEIEKLEKIGIVWREQVLDKESKYDFECLDAYNPVKDNESSISPKNKTDFEWLYAYKAVYEYFKNSESSIIPKNLKVSVNGKDIYLKVWLDKQDKLSKLNSLSDDREELFRNVILLRESKQINDLTWLKMFKLAIMYLENNGNLDIPFDYVINEDNEELKLGRWLARQIELYHCNRLSLEKINVLSKLGIDLEVKEKKLKYN